MGIGPGSDRQSVFRPAGTDGRPDQNSARPAIHWYKLNAGRPTSRSIRGVGSYLGGPRSGKGKERTKELHRAASAGPPVMIIRYGIFLRSLVWNNLVLCGRTGGDRDLSFNYSAAPSLWNELHTELREPRQIPVSYTHLTLPTKRIV